MHLRGITTMRPFRPTSTERLGSSLRAWGRARDGGVAVTVAVTSAVLVGVLAISIDLGRAYNLSTELDNAADAYALAGATQLDNLTAADSSSGVGACTRAMQAAIDASLKNTETFASNPSGADVYIDETLNHLGNKNIRFLTDLDKNDDGDLINYIDTGSLDECDETAEFIEVFIDRTSPADSDLYRVGYSFAGILGAVTETFPKGYAVAGYEVAYCARIPMFICPLTGSGPSAAVDFFAEVQAYDHTGKGVWLKSENNNDQWFNGNLGFLRMGNVGANELGEAVGMVNNPFSCIGGDDIYTEPGANESAAKAFNSRLDIFHNGGMADPSLPQWQPAANGVKGLVRGSSNACGLNGQGYEDPPTPYTGPGSYNPIPADPAMPLPRDECAYGGSCVPVGGGGRMGTGDWESDIYFQVNHPNYVAAGYSVADLLVPTTSGGLGDNSGTAGIEGFVDIDWEGDGAGGNHPDGIISRLEMYLWELGRTYGSENYGAIDEAYPNNLVNNTGSPGSGGFPQGGEYAGTQCYSYPGGLGDDLGDPDDPSDDVVLQDDRRVIDVLLVDCDALAGSSGNFNVPDETIIGSVKFFVVEPWSFGGGDHDIYVELIGPGEKDELDKKAKKNIVQLYE
jgi:Flp pilus assembly protein TadG